MKKIWICAVLLGAVSALGGCGIAGQADGLGEAVGGWIQGEEQEPETEEEPSGPETGQEQETEGGKEEAPAPIAGGTDQEGSGLSVELYRIAGATLIFRIDNQSDVSYSSVQFSWRFQNQPGSTFADENGFPQMANASGEVPAYASVYELVSVPDYTILHGDSKQENPDDVFYYNWIHSAEDVVGLQITGWEVSDTVLQDASDWVELEKDPDAGSGRLGYAWNRSDTPIRFQTAVIYGGTEGGFTESADYLPPAGVIMEESGGERPRYDGGSGNARAIVYAGEYLAPTGKDQMTASEIAAAGEDLYQPDAAAFENCEILITRAYFERN